MTREQLARARALVERWNEAPTSIWLAEDGLDALELLAAAVPVLAVLAALEVAKAEQRTMTGQAKQAADRAARVLAEAAKDAVRRMVGA